MMLSNKIVFIFFGALLASSLAVCGVKKQDYLSEELLIQIEEKKSLYHFNFNEIDYVTVSEQNGIKKIKTIINFHEGGHEFIINNKSLVNNETQNDKLKYSFSYSKEKICFEIENYKYKCYKKVKEGIKKKFNSIVAGKYKTDDNRVVVFEKSGLTNFDGIKKDYFVVPESVIYGDQLCIDKCKKLYSYILTVDNITLVELDINSLEPLKKKEILLKKIMH